VTPDTAVTGPDLDALAAWDEQARRVVGFAYCRRCGGVGLVDADRLCTGCLEDDRWAYVNRAFCELLHRARPLPRPADPEPAGEA
jgi:hypothetical protein